MQFSAKILGIGGAAILAIAAMSPAAAMPAAPKAAVVDVGSSDVIQVQNRGFNRGGNWRQGYNRGFRQGYRAAPGPRYGYRPGYRWYNRPGYGWGWWGPGIAAGVIAGAALAAPYYYGAPGPGMCRVWGPGYWTWAPCDYPY